MVRIRFRRVGTRHQPTYRIVAAERESPRDGRFLEVIGFYNPRTEPATVQVDERRLFHWMKNGAQPSTAVTTTLKAIGTWERWERFKQGETLDVLVAEATQVRAEINPRTRRDDLATTRRRKRRRVAEGEEAAASAPEQPARSTAASQAPAEQAMAEAGKPASAAEPAADAAETAAEAPAEPEPTPDEPA